MNKLKKGDTFCINTPNMEFKYILITYIDTSEYEEKLNRNNVENKNIFYLSLSNSIPNKNSILSNFIISNNVVYNRRLYPIDATDKRLFEDIEKSYITGAKPDKYQYLYSYLFSFSNKEIKKMIKTTKYLGTFSYSHPLNEYIPNQFCNDITDLKIENVIEKGYNAYKLYNLKKSIIFNDERNRVIIENSIKERELNRYLHDEIDINVL